MTKRRRSYEAGHSPKFMVVIDDSPECDRALYFASRRALRVGATVPDVTQTKDAYHPSALVDHRQPAHLQPPRSLHRPANRLRLIS